MGAQKARATRRALVLGGTGTIGREVVRGLCQEGVETRFVYHRSEEAARALSEETGAEGKALDLKDRDALRGYLRGLRQEGQAPGVLVHAAADPRIAPLEGSRDEDWDAAMGVHCRSVFVACQELAPHFKDRGRGEVVVLGALSPSQSLPVPSLFAATQGALAAMVMALAKELGPAGVHVNMIVSGLLGQGVSGALPASMVEDYKTFSALRRQGRPEEIARAVLWLALENTYVNGQCVPVNGGI